MNQYNIMNEIYIRTLELWFKMIIIVNRNDEIVLLFGFIN